MPGARMLDDSALEAHCQMLTAQAPDVYAHLRHPGLPEDEIRSQFAAAGVRPSDEVIRWWSFWRRAPESERKSLGFNLEVLPECAFVTVQECVEAHRGTEWLTRQQLRFEPARGFWWPLDAYYMAWPKVLDLPPVV